jgi:hypothetical protein
MDHVAFLVEPPLEQCFPMLLQQHDAVCHFESLLAPHGCGKIPIKIRSAQGDDQTSIGDFANVPQGAAGGLVSMYGNQDITALSVVPVDNLHDVPH